MTTWDWYKSTSTVIGVPVLAYLLMLGIQGSIFTLTCSIAGYQCKYAFVGDSFDKSISGIAVSSSVTDPVALENAASQYAAKMRQGKK